MGIEYLKALNEAMESGGKFEKVKEQAASIYGKSINDYIDVKERDANVESFF